MHSIVTITFSPCIDKSTSVPELIPEKKLLCSAPKLEAGGGGINVARAIKKLGGKVTAIFPSGGYTGKYFNHLLDEENIDTIIIEAANETRENLVVLEECTKKQYRFGMPGTMLEEKEWKQCLQAVEQADDLEYIIASGSLAPGVPRNVYARLAVIARHKNAKLFLDSSGDALKMGVEEGPYLVKPNLGELSSLSGVKNIDTTNATFIAKEIINRNNIEIMVVSLGAGGAILVTKNECYHAIPPEVEIKSTVGAGDSMTAGIVLGISQGMSLQQVIQYGVACGTAATLNAGTELCNKAAADYLFSVINSNNQ